MTCHRRCPGFSYLSFRRGLQNGKIIDGSSCDYAGWPQRNGVGCSRALAWRLTSIGPFDAVVAIARGGLVPATIVARELNIRTVETVAVKSYDHQNQGGIKVLKPISQSILDMAKNGAKVLIVDDLVDTGSTARLVRDMLPGAHFATVYAKPMGRELVDTFITEVSQDTWIFFPWDLDVAYAAPIGGGTD